MLWAGFLLPLLITVTAVASQVYPGFGQGPSSTFGVVGSVAQIRPPGVGSFGPIATVGGTHNVYESPYGYSFGDVPNRQGYDGAMPGYNRDSLVNIAFGDVGVYGNQQAGRGLAGISLATNQHASRGLSGVPLAFNQRAGRGLAGVPFTGYQQHPIRQVTTSQLIGSKQPARLVPVSHASGKAQSGAGVEAVYSEKHDEGGGGKGVEVNEKKKQQQHEQEKTAVFQKGYDAKKYKLENAGYDFDRGFRYAYQYGHLFFNPVPAYFNGQKIPVGYPYGRGGATYGGAGYGFNEGRGKRKLEEYSQDARDDGTAVVGRATYVSPTVDDKETYASATDAGRASYAAPTTGGRATYVSATDGGRAT
ncbi:PREDICTED: uncharacterized protein LOC106807349 isoform X2 [Priapulus caudatus]|uniref:Uncharacterized protein LOC106807349 isoform X2 n=1 Tax=Priapulus caudatus TaxID=37621 RepID=A0ABM1DYX3_PRICU|nr:PREDICTED: uncharacterized protein LOC106807349 isoform X2 [Priapulus caudatus]